MISRVLHDFMTSIRPCRSISTKYNHGASAETTELQTLTGDSEEIVVAEDAVVAERATPEEVTSSTRVDGLSSFQHYRQRFSGWRVGVLNFAVCGSAVFMINLVVTIWGSVSHQKNQGVLNEGDCGHIKSLNSGLHVLINVLSTILLSGSNYCMQCLSAPTRAEVDRAHTARRWLDIGIPSFRNLRYIKRRRLVLWLLLGISSLPIHLL
jgi:hypothetical protein